MPELSDALHELYDAEASLHVLPARGMNVLTGEARTVRRRAMLRSGLLGAAGAVVVSALVLGGIHAFGETKTPATTPSASASPEPSTTPVLWNPQSETSAAMAGFTIPQCGDAFAPSEQSVDNVAIAADAGYTDELSADGSGQFLMNVLFNSTDGERRSFLATGYGYVITQHGKVVAAEMPSADDMELYGTGGHSDNSATAFGKYNCAANAAVDQLYKDRGWDPDADHSEAENTTMSAATEKLLKGFLTWPSGDYQVYVFTPVVFGDQLAAAQALKAEGVATVAGIRTDMGNVLFVNDERMAPYCTQTGDQFSCNPPQDVVDEVLTFEVDPATVDNAPPGLAISAPVNVTVP